MKPSIRSFLLFNLLVSVALIGFLTVIAHLFLAHQKIQTYIDKQLILASVAVHTVLKNEQSLTGLQHIKIDCNTLVNLQQTDTNQPESNNTNESIKIVNALSGKSTDKKINLAELCNQIQLQVWNNSGERVLSSSNMFDNTNLNANGFSNQVVDKLSWRVLVTKSDYFKLALAERYDLYSALEEEIASHTIWIMIFSLPLLALLIWIIVGKALSSLKRIAAEVKNRAPSYLKEVKIEDLPSEIQPLVKELNNLLLKVSDAFQREERFASDAAHELRTPLAALRAHVHVALNATNKEERNRSLHSLITGIERSTHVVNQLLTLSRATRLKTDGQLKTTTVSINKIAKDIISELVPVAMKKNIEVELISQHKEQFITGDPITIGVLIKNLIDNSIRYIDHTHGLIQVVVDGSKKYAILKVIDNGPGIPQKMRKEVFKRFVRLENSRNVQGSGLGLNIVQQIIQQHHAKIKLATPRSGHGLEVDVIFNKGNAIRHKNT